LGIIIPQHQHPQPGSTTSWCTSHYKQASKAIWRNGKPQGTQSEAWNWPNNNPGRTNKSENSTQHENQSKQEAAGDAIRRDNRESWGSNTLVITVDSHPKEEWGPPTTVRHAHT
jgi:hypothetical protein